MDLEAIYNVPESHKLFTLPEFDALRENTNPSGNILIYAFIGGWMAAQKESLEVAIDQVRKRYLLLGYTIQYESFSNDDVRNVHRWNASQLFTKLLSADIHLLPTHCHQGMISLGGTDVAGSWNIANILENYDRLRYHLGIPNGRHLKCPVFTQNKGMLYESLSRLGLCLPTAIISIKDGILTTEMIINIASFVDYINSDPLYCTTQERFMTKLSYTTNGSRGKNVKPSVNGVNGIIQSIREMLNDERISGYYDEVVIQPFWMHNTEAKVICFDGVPVGRNTHKRGEKSGLARSSNEILYAFARRVIDELRASCPELIADGILRIDFFGELGPDEKVKRFIVNEIEGFEACLWGAGKSAGDMLSKIMTYNTAYWKMKLETLIDCHLEMQAVRTST